jgi:septal ring factor EnvC (AmiA/AmiB activator)
MRLLPVLLAFFMLSQPVAAAKQDVHQELKQTTSRIKEAEQKQQVFQKERAVIKKELDTTQKRILALAEETRGYEDRLEMLEKNQQKTQKKVTKIRESLQGSRQEILSLTTALTRLANVPEEAVIAMPNSLHTSLHAASVLRSMTEKLRKATASLTNKLDQLEHDKTLLEQQKQQISAQREELHQAQTTLAAEIEQRQQAYTKLGDQQKQQAKVIAKLSAESRSLQDLIARLEKSRTEQKKVASQTLAKPLPAGVGAVSSAEKPSWQPLKAIVNKLPSLTSPAKQFSEAKGKLRYPVAGGVIARFGEKLGQNQTSKGVTLSARAGNTVTAPFGGEVVFTGPFLTYGNMVILRYEQGYHLLLAGLSRVHCRTGQRITTGEPVGIISGGNSGNKLYLELRHQGKAINPSAWFG